MGIIAWIILGALAGWIASIIMKRDSSMGAVANIIVGIVGAFIGGWLADLAGFGGVDGFNLGSIITAIVGACLLLFIIGKIKR